MSSPLEAFRKHQRVMMAALTALSMIAFIFLDNLSQASSIPPGMTVLLLALICGAGLWFVGASRGKGSEWASAGAIIGALVGFISFYTSGPPPVASTSVKNFTQSDIAELQAKRNLANSFVYAAIRKSGVDPRQNAGFGSGQPDAMVEHALRVHEAHKEGIHLADSAVTQFINDLTAEKLSKPDYKAVLREIGVSEGDLYNVLREELEARLVAGLNAPPYGGGGRLPVTQTPEQLWEYFRRLNVKEAISAAPLPVASFVGQVPEPKEPELLAFFEMHKNSLPAPGRPGFLIPERVRLAYLMADFEKFEGKATEPTDAEITEYYEKNRERYRVRSIPESGSPGADAMKGGPADAVQPANPSPAAPAANDGRPPAPALPEGAAVKPDAEQSAPAKPESEAPAEEQPKSCGEDEPAAEASTTQAEEKQAEEKLPDAAPAVKPEPAKAEEPTEPAAADKPEAKPAAEAPASDQPAKSDLDLPALPPLPGAGAKPAEPQYRTLDADLTSEIRDQLLRERTFQLMGEAIDAGFKKMGDLSGGFLGKDDQELAAAYVAASDSLKTLARELNLDYVETPLLTEEQLSDGKSDPIGLALDGAQPSNPFAQATSVADAVFGTTQIYFARRAESVGERRYAYWKIADEETRVPEFKDEGVREAVLAAWKLEKARPLAEKRARELVEIARKNGGDLAAALAGQTVTGATDGSAVTVLNPPKFSWMSQPQNVPQQSFLPTQPPTISSVLGIDNAGPAFMKTAFDELGPGEVGATANATGSEYYVIRVNERDGAGTSPDAAVAAKALEQQFANEGRTGADGRSAPLFGFMQFGLPSPYIMISFEAQQMIEEARRRHFQEKYDVVFSGPASQTE